MKQLSECLEGKIRTAAIAGHLHPDGDCVGSCTALWHYLREVYPFIRAVVYLEEPKEPLKFLLEGVDVRYEADPEEVPDLLIILDTSTVERIGVAGCYLETAERTVCIDHHISNSGFAQVNHVVSDASSASEVLYELLIPEKISGSCAAALYTGIIHDTGVFQYPNTSPRTMEIGGALIARGVPFSEIIENTFLARSYTEQRVIGRALTASELLEDGRLILTCTDSKTLAELGADARDVDMVVATIRQTRGVEIAVYLYQKEEGSFKVSLRSAGRANVNRIASVFGGGGHVNASGCTIDGTEEEVRERLLPVIRTELQRIAAV